VLVTKERLRLACISSMLVSTPDSVDCAEFIATDFRGILLTLDLSVHILYTQ